MPAEPKQLADMRTLTMVAFSATAGVSLPRKDLREPQGALQVPPLRLRSGRDDNSVAGVGHCSVASIPATTELSSRPERTRVSYYDMAATTTCAALRSESRMEFISATSGGTCCFCCGHQAFLVR
jgi:hypothetical protein